jgi:hypothetical protein
MCPLCIATTALLAFGATSTGGLVALALGKDARRVVGPKNPATSSCREADDDRDDGPLPPDLR